jgi:hypothetical protein
MQGCLAAICLFSLLALAGGCNNSSLNGLATKPRVERIDCLVCHAAKTMKPAYRKVASEWRQSVHYKNGIACNDCHGGDPNNIALAMSPTKGFVGVPTFQGVMQFCGKYHIDIMKSCCMGGAPCTNSHCVALMTTGKGPNCVTCHGAHDVKKANIDLINPQLCGKCHSYAPAQAMKAALWKTEQKIEHLQKNLQTLKDGLIPTSDAEQVLYRTKESYRSLFHTVDVKMVQDKTAVYNRKLDALQSQVQKSFQELYFRRYFALWLLLIFVGLGIAFFLLTRKPK